MSKTLFALVADKQVDFGSRLPYTGKCENATKQSPVILDLYLRKIQAENSHDYIYMIV